VVNGLGIIE